jgi:hypothetical protein
LSSIFVQVVGKGSQGHVVAVKRIANPARRRQAAGGAEIGHALKLMSINKVGLWQQGSASPTWQQAVRPVAAAEPCRATADAAGPAAAAQRQAGAAAA